MPSMFYTFPTGLEGGKRHCYIPVSFPAVCYDTIPNGEIPSALFEICDAKICVDVVESESSVSKRSW